MDKIGHVPDRYLSEEQRLMRQTCRRYVDEVVWPFIAANREREWLFDRGYPGPGGGLWLRMIFPAGLVTWLVPSARAVSVHPSWCSTT